VRVPLLGQIDLEWSQTYRFFARRQWRVSLLRGAPGADLAAVRAFVPCVENRTTYPGDGEELLVRLCARLDQIVRAGGADLRLVFVPRPREVEDAAGDTYYTGIRRVLEAQGVPSLDLREDARRRGMTPERLFGAGDAHLSADGSRMAAEALRDALIRR
jgi:hypothetical protein